MNIITGISKKWSWKQNILQCCTSAKLFCNIKKRKQRSKFCFELLWF